MSSREWILFDDVTRPSVVWRFEKGKVHRVRRERSNYGLCVETWVRTIVFSSHHGGPDTPSYDTQGDREV